MSSDHPPSFMSDAAAAPTDRRALLAGIGGLAAGALLARQAAAGPLTPGAGPVSPTGKTLTQVEPRVDVATLPPSAAAQFVISEPGSYYLSANVQGVAGKAGIAIAASNVTLDLNGFALLGVPGSLDGVVATTSLINVAVRGGSVVAWGGTGVNLISVVGAAVSDVMITGCQGSGLTTGGQSVVERCTARENGVWGLRIGGLSVVAHCVSAGNGTGAGGQGGILLGINSTCETCAVTGNGSAAAVVGGVQLFSGAALRGCLMDLNLPFGVLVSGAATVVQDCRINGNSPSALGVRGSSLGECRIEGNAFNALAAGIDTQGMAGVAVRNSFRNVQAPLLGGTVLFGPSVNSGNIAGTTSPHGNYVF